MTVAELPKLTLPAYGAELRHNINGTGMQIYDVVRKKWVALTPEEWVRQHFVNMLINCYGYSAFRLGNERSIRINGQLKRCDTIIYNDIMQPIGIIEYKAPDVKISQTVIDQISRYNIVIDAPLLIVCNGMHTHAAMVHGQPGNAAMVHWLADIPTCDSLNQITIKNTSNRIPTTHTVSKSR